MNHRGEVNGVPVAFSDHALQRMVDMKIPAHTALAALSEPDWIGESLSIPGARNYHYEDIALGVQDDDGVLVVTTVLWATKAAWAKAARDGRMGAGRQVRENIALPDGRPS